MGLDQYAFTADNTEEVKDGNVHMMFEWRKHAKLHEFMVDVFNKKGGIYGERDFNCNPVELSLDDIDQLEEAIKTKTLPHSEGGCFWGHHSLQLHEAVILLLHPPSPNFFLHVF